MTRSSESPVTSHESSEALPGGQPEAKLASEWRPGSQSHRPGPPAGQPEMTVTNTGSSDRHLRRRGPRHLARARHERDRDRASVTSPRRRLCLRGCQSRGSDQARSRLPRTGPRAPPTGRPLTRRAASGLSRWRILYGPALSRLLAVPAARRSGGSRWRPPTV